jgi:hypothetical protein
LQELIQGLHPIAWKPNPEDGAPGVLQPLLRWSTSDTAVLHDVYLGTSPELGPQDRVASRQSATAPAYWHTPGFTPGTMYYWRVDGIDAAGTVTPGRVWMFVSASLTAYQPQPADGAKWIDPQAVTLGWSAGMNALYHDVYFGTSAQDVAADGRHSQAEQAGFQFVCRPRARLWLWRIDETARRQHEEGRLG